MFANNAKLQKLGVMSPICIWDTSQGLTSVGWQVTLCNAV